MVFYRKKAAGTYSPLPYAFAQHDACSSHARPPNCGHCDVLFPELLESLLRFPPPRMLIPIWRRWYYWGSPVAWTVYGLVTFQVGDRRPLVEIPGEAHMSVQIYFKTRLGFEYDFLGAVVAHISFVLLFLFVHICLRYQVSQLPNQMSK